MGLKDQSLIYALGDQAIEKPRDLFTGAVHSSHIENIIEPRHVKEIGNIFFDVAVGGGQVEYIEFDEDFVAVLPKFNFVSNVPIRFADSNWIRMHFRIGGRNTTFFEKNEQTIEGPLCNLMRLPDGMLATEVHGDEQVNWLTVFCKPDFMMRAFGLDKMALPNSLEAAFKSRSDQLVLESTSLPAQAWRLLAELDRDLGPSPVAVARWQAMVTELICLLLEQLTQSNSGYQPDLSPRERERILEARDLILHNLNAPPTIADLARALGTNRTTLTQDFRHYFGQSIYDTIKTERMAEAVRLLEQGANVGDAARRLGYSSTAAFSYAFKQHFGVSPSQSRTTGR